MRHPDFNIDTFIEGLQGTCDSMQEALDKMYPDMYEDDILPSEQTHISHEIFNCDTCNWWYEISEQSTDGSNCCNCVDDDDEDE